MILPLGLNGGKINGLFVGGKAGLEAGKSPRKVVLEEYRAQRILIA